MFGTLLALLPFAFTEAPSPLAVLPRLSHAEAAVRRAACRELGAMGSRASAGIRPLVGRLDDPDLEVRIAAAEALGDIGPESVREMLHADRLWTQEMPDNVFGGGPLPGPNFAFDLPFPRYSTHWHAFCGRSWDEPSLPVRLALRRLGRAEGPALLAVLQSKTASLPARRRAMVRLQSVRPCDPDLVPTLIDLLEHDELGTHAVGALESLGTEIADGLPALLRSASDRDGNLRGTLAKFINRPTQAESDEAARLLARAPATQPSADVRRDIARALAGSTDPQVLRHLVPLLDMPETANVAAPALVEEPGEVGRRARELTLKAIGNDEMRLPVQVGVAWMRDPDRAVRDAALNPNIRYLRWTPAAFDTLAKVLVESDADTKSRVLDLIEREQLGSSRLEAALRRLVVGPDVEPAGRAAVQLMRMDVVDDALREPIVAGLLRQWSTVIHSEADHPDWSRRVAPAAMRIAESGDEKLDRSALARLHELGPAVVPLMPRLLALRGKPELRPYVDWILNDSVTESFEHRCLRIRHELRSWGDADRRRLAVAICLLPVRARELVPQLLRRSEEEPVRDHPERANPVGDHGIDGALMVLGSPAAIEGIIARVKDPTDDDGQVCAWWVLPNLGTAGRPAAQALHERSAREPYYFAWNLARIGADVPDDLIERASKDEVPTFRDGGGMYGLPLRPAPVVPKLLRKPWWPDRNMIEAALGDFSPAAAALLVPTLRELLVDKDDRLRLQALHAVNRLQGGTEPLLGELIDCLGAFEPQVVEGAAYALARLGPAAAPAVPRLCRLARIGHEAMPVAVALGRIGSPQAVAALRAMLDDADDHVRWAACTGLWHAGERGATAIGTLRVLLDDGNLKLLAAETLLRIAPARGVKWALPALVSRLDSDESANVFAHTETDSLVECGPAAVPHLIGELQRRDDDLGGAVVWRRAGALRALGELGPAAADALPAIRALRSHFGWLRAARAAAIARIERRIGPCVELLRQELLSNHSTAMHELMSAVIECREVSAIADLSWAPHAGIRRRAVEAMGRMPWAAEITGRHLAARLDDTDSRVRAAAGHAFHLLGPSARSALPALRELEAIDDPVLRDALREARRAVLGSPSAGPGNRRP